MREQLHERRWTQNVGKNEANVALGIQLVRRFNEHSDCRGQNVSNIHTYTPGTISRPIIGQVTANSLGALD